MYDWPEISAATDEFWTVLRDCLLRRGIEAPATLTRQVDLAALWHSKELMVGQTCGLPFATGLNRHVRLIGTPSYDIGCAPGCYYSVLIAPKGSGTALDGFSGSLAINSYGSQSGFAALVTALVAAGVDMGGVEIQVSGAHRASIEAVASGKAELAAIDAVSFRLAERHVPEIDGVEVICCTCPTPGLPLITALPSGAVDALAAATEEAIRLLEPSLRRQLLLTGFRRSKAEDYAGIERDWRLIEAVMPQDGTSILKASGVPR
ncbi:PhnD/SsuA/transferrin family substrate-binding protein [Neorhizobium sp. NCHU2750]|uniref:phosphate/phosphite/phosphonate ABC transporter substrate-binding protein n=1 Tax=Neorhizobium sp. NCHU2750 TaxID=1825976 RepID=UPI0013C404BC